MKRLAAGVVLTMALTGSVQAQEFWDKKPFKEWTKDQVNKLLQNSPWASHAGEKTVAQNLAFNQAGGTGGQDNERSVDYFAQIWSARPVREAVIRRVMLQNKYDKMTADQQKAFDQSADAYIARQYPDVIVIGVEYSSNIDMVERELALYWQNVPPNSAPVDIYLIGHNGIRIQPIRYEADRGGGRLFQLVFPRVVNDQPVVSPGDKTLRLEIPVLTIDPAVTGTLGGATNSGLRTRRALFEFKVEKMKYKGEVVF